MDFIRSRNGIERLRKKATDRGFIQDLDYYKLLDISYNIKICRMLYGQLWTCL